MSLRIKKGEARANQSTATPKANKKTVQADYTTNETESQAATQPLRNRYTIRKRYKQLQQCKSNTAPYDTEQYGTIKAKQKNEVIKFGTQ